MQSFRIIFYVCLEGLIAECYILINENSEIKCRFINHSPVLTIIYVCIHTCMLSHAQTHEGLGGGVCASETVSSGRVSVDECIQRIKCRDNHRELRSINSHTIISAGLTTELDDHPLQEPLSD